MYSKIFGKNTLYPTPKNFEIITKDFLTGKAIRVLEPYQSGEKLALIEGEINNVISPDSIQINEEKHLHDPHILGLLMHSCSPNTVFDIKRKYLIACCPIKTNTFLTIDYTITEDYLFKQFQCRCGTKNCKGWILGKKETQAKRVESHDI